MATTNESATAAPPKAPVAVYYRETAEGMEAALEANLKKQRELAEEQRQLEQQLSAHYKTLLPVVYALVETNDSGGWFHGYYSNLNNANAALAQNHDNNPSCFIEERSTEHFSFEKFRTLDN